MFADAGRARGPAPGPDHQLQHLRRRPRRRVRQPLARPSALLAPTLETARRSLVNLNAALPPLRGAGDRARARRSPSCRTRSPPACPGSSRRSRCSRAASWAAIAAAARRAARPTRRRPSSRRSPAAAGADDVQPLRRREPDPDRQHRAARTASAGNDFSSGQPELPRVLLRRRPASPARAPTSTATASTSASSPAAGRSRSSGQPRAAASTPASMFGNTIAAAAGHAPAPTGAAAAPLRRALLQRTPIPNLNGPAAAAGPPSPRAYHTVRRGDPRPPARLHRDHRARR